MKLNSKMIQLQTAVSGFGRWANDLDRTWLATALASALVVIVSPDQAKASALFTITALVDITPFLFFAIAVAAYAKGAGADSLIARAFKGRMSIMILLAAVFGSLSPFCSCGVIPLIAALLSMGVPIPAVMAFWLSSPLMDPSKFIVASGTLGFDFALALTFVAVCLGIIGGFATRVAMTYGAFSTPLRHHIGNSCCGSSPTLEEVQINWAFWKLSDRRKIFTEECIDTTLFLLKWLTLAFFIESLMIAYIPGESIGKFLGVGSTWAIPLAAIIGVPAYLNPFAAVPLIDGLLDMGVIPGAGMAFLVAGAVTSVPAAIAVFALVKRGLFGWYIFLALSGALISGMLFQVYSG